MPKGSGPNKQAAARRLQAEQLLRQAKLLDDWTDKYPGYAFPEAFHAQYIEKGNIPPAPPEIKAKAGRERAASVEKRKELLRDVRYALVQNFHRFFNSHTAIKGSANTRDLERYLVLLLEQIVDHQRELRIEGSERLLSKAEKEKITEKDRVLATCFKGFCKIHHKDVGSAIEEATSSTTDKKGDSKPSTDSSLSTVDLTLARIKKKKPERTAPDEEEDRERRRNKRHRGSPASTESEEEEGEDRPAD